MSHARANSQSRLTVATEMPTTSAISESVSPPKYRNSTTLGRSGVELLEPLQRLVQRLEILVRGSAKPCTSESASLTCLPPRFPAWRSRA